MKNKIKDHWGNCGAFYDESLVDEEILNIDAMEDSIGPLDDNTIAIRGLITRFESCYHEADKEAERIIRAIGSQQLPVESNERPPQRKQELQNSLDILLAWHNGDPSKCAGLDVGGISADELVAYLGEPTDLKIWQVERLIDKLKFVLGLSNNYHNLELSIDGYGQPIDIRADEYHKDHLDFLRQTTVAQINFTLNGKKDQISLALAIDMFRPCNWNYVRNFVIMLKAINGDLNPKETFAPCCFNKELTPLRGRLKVISNSLIAFYKNDKEKQDIDNNMIALLGSKTDKKYWLAASLDKTIRLHQGF